LLHAQFEPDVHGFLRVDTIENYISGFFANIVINGIAIVAVFMLVLVILAVVGAALDIIGKLPVINMFNRIGGLAFGTLMGAGIAWISIVVLSMYFASSADPQVYGLLHNSVIARRFLDSMIEQLTAVP
jgi:uncharacterized membrane protein required for colicin V production